MFGKFINKITTNNDDRESVLKAVAKDGEALQYAKKFQNDKEVVALASKNKFWAFEYASDELKKDKDFILQLNYHCFKYADLSLKRDKNFVLELIKEKSAYIIKGADESLKKDREVAIETVSRIGEMIKFIDENLQNDKEILILAIQNTHFTDWFSEIIPKKMGNDKEVILEAIKKSDSIFKDVNESLKKDKKFILMALKESSCVYHYIHKSLKSDRDIVITAIQGRILTRDACSFKDFKKFNFKDFPSSVKKDRNVVLALVKNSGYQLNNVDKKFKKDKEIVLEAIKKDSQALKYADKEVIKELERDALAKSLRN